MQNLRYLPINTYLSSATMSLSEIQELVEMGSEEEKNESFIGVNDIKLIDFLNEDDFLVDQRYRDSLEDLRLSGSILIC